MRARRPGGFTLVEILATLGVLAIGLAAIVAMILGSSRATAAAADRNIANIILTEAIEDIQRNHMVTPELAANFATAATPSVPEDVGLYIETGPPTTTPTVPPYEYPNIHTAPYSATFFRSVKIDSFINPYVNPATNVKETMVWPPSLVSPRYGGPLASASYSSNGAGGVPFRVLYSLVRHSDWIAAEQANTDETPFRGVYVLTLAAYKDLDPSKTPNDATKRYEQVSEPMTVYLRAKTP